MVRSEQERLWMLLAGVFISRLPFRARMPYGLDSIQFVLAVDHFDVRLHQPHPPGYFLFVLMGKIGNFFFHDPNLSFVALNVVCSVLAVWLTYWLSRDLFGIEGAWLAALLMATSPLVWFHGEVALSNMMDCFLVCLTALLCWRAAQGNGRAGGFAALALGLAGGVRQNTLLFLVALWLWSLRKFELRKRLVFGAVLGATCICWYVPMALLSGGIRQYQTALRDHWLNSNWHGFTLAWLPFNFITVTYFALLGLGLASVLLLIGLLFFIEKSRGRGIWREARLQFFAAWLAPPLAFFLFVYSHPIQTGHSLVYLPALFALIPQASALMVGRARGTVLASLALLNTLSFLFMNMPMSRTRLETYQRRVTETITMVRSQCRPEDTILLNADFMFLGFRDFMFHLPEFRSYQPKLYVLDGRSRIFAGENRETLLLDAISVAPGVKHFVLVADEVEDNPTFVNRVSLERSIPGQFFTTESGVRLFRGSIRDLAKLFPKIPLNAS
ncbi:MAG: glycosyltransferase family 39 protein [Acidobacteria bacterium]|nr:glycosyltransferase family 39 protein [Acidobacteriota bacterium]MCI0718499.1 glycosyltransferase family 39 protein [Acidobacteriota bacterium]